MVGSSGEFPIDYHYPAITSSINKLSTDYVFDLTDENQDPLCTDAMGDELPAWLIKSVNNRIANWRKPVPFWLNPNAGVCDTDYLNHEPFNDKNSYRYYAEYIAYLTGWYGTNSGMPDFYNFNDTYFQNVPQTGNGWFNHIELWNEPDPWWVKPNDYGYFKPAELAKLCEAALDNNTTTDFYTYQANDCVDPPSNTIVSDTVGFKSLMQVISPSPHEMDVEYMRQLLTEIRTNTSLGSNFNFGVYAFHHYSAYSASQLDKIGGSGFSSTDGCTNAKGFLTPSIIAANSVLTRGTTHPYDLNSSQDITTVNLESEPGARGAYWLCPELDGYLERGEMLFNSLNSLTDGAPIWITEWGYPSITDGSAATYIGGLPAEETQARWMMRGFMEFDRSPHIEASYWHWLEDTPSASTWDTRTGLLDGSGGRKTSWWYMRTMMNEIGDKGWFDSVEYGDCEKDFVPGIHKEEGTGIYVPDVPCDDCPKIYKYTDSCCTGLGGNSDDGDEDFNKTVWAIWFPYMLGDQSKSTMKFYLGSDLKVQGIPTQFYTVEPIKGKINGNISDNFPVLYDQMTDSYYINLEISEKPLFVHFIGECVCGNDDLGNNPGGLDCNLGSKNESYESTCTTIEITFEIEWDDELSCNLEAPIITSANPGGVSLSSSGTPANGGNIGSSFAIINNTTLKYTVSGLDPQTCYNMPISIGYRSSTEFGFATLDFPSCTSDATSCFQNLMINSTIDVDEGCNGAEIIMSLSSDVNDDVSVLTANVSIAEVVQGTNTCSETSTFSLGSVPAFDWEETSPGNYEVKTSISDQLSSNSCYCMSYEITGSDGTIYAENPNPLIFCTDPCPSIATPVTEIIASCESICFTPIVVEGESCVHTAYRYEINDQDGNTISDFFDFKDADCNAESLCFSGQDYQDKLDMLGTPPYVGHIRTIVNTTDANNNPQFVTDNSDFFTFECGCEEEPRQISYYNSCENASVVICFEDNSCLGDTELTVSDLGVNITGGHLIGTVGPFQLGRFAGCFMVGFQKDDVCANIFYEIYLDGVLDSNGNPVNVSSSGAISYVLDDSFIIPPPFPTPYNCCDSDGPIIPTEVATENLDVETFTQSGSKIHINGSINPLKEYTDQSRGNNIPVKFVTIEKGVDILSADNFVSQVNISLEESRYDSVYLNNKYDFHLLAGNFVFKIIMPEINPNNPPITARSAEEDVENNLELTYRVFPNPMSNSCHIEHSKIMEKVDIYSLTGQLILSQGINDFLYSLNVKSMDIGVYFMHIWVEDGSRPLVQKIVVQR